MCAAYPRASQEAFNCSIALFILAGLCNASYTVAGTGRSAAGAASAVARVQSPSLAGESPRVRCNVVVHFKAAPIRVPEADQGYEVVFQVLFDRQLLDPAIPQDDELPYLSRGNTGYQRTADVDVRQRDRLHLSV